MKTPDITKGQMVAALIAIANLLAAFGVYHVTPDQLTALETAMGGGVGLMIADSIVRHGRAIGGVKAKAADVPTRAPDISDSAPA